MDRAISSDLAGAILSIDLMALQANYRELARKAGDAECGAAVKGNAYGLANTLRQTAFLKPSMRSKKVDNLFYAGQLTVPGPGVPTAIISGQIAATSVTEMLKKSRYEAVI